MIKLKLEIVANNNEEMLKALAEIKNTVDLGATFLSRKNHDGYDYKGEIEKV